MTAALNACLAYTRIHLLSSFRLFQRLNPNLFIVGEVSSSNITLVVPQKRSKWADSCALRCPRSFMRSMWSRAYSLKHNSVSSRAQIFHHLSYSPPRCVSFLLSLSLYSIMRLEQYCKTYGSTISHLFTQPLFDLQTCLLWYSLTVCQHTHGYKLARSHLFSVFWLLLWIVP